MRAFALHTVFFLAAYVSADSPKTISNPKTPPVTVKGNAFFANNKRFYIRGLDYQPHGSSNVSDPLLNLDEFKRDVKEFQKLGINTIRVYTIDNAPSANHDEGMKLLADAGIYLALDVNTPQNSLNRLNEKALHMSYNDVYLKSVFATVDKFAKYDNTLLFFSANEVMNQANMSFCAPYIKAVTRDMKQYIKKRGYRTIPVGYSAADIPEIQTLSADYFNCGADISQADFFAFNDYSWCNSDYLTAGWDKKVKNYTDYSRPIFLSEFGCNHVRPRAWTEIKSLYSSNMTSVYSGGLVYEYTQEANNYGLVSISGMTLTENVEFTSLKQTFENVKVPSGDGGYRENIPKKACPPQGGFWSPQGEALPDMPEGAVKMMDDGAGPGPGLKSTSSSQTAGTPSKSSSVPSGDGGKPKSGASILSPSCLLVVLGLAAIIHLI